jgi:hypothetical protein
MIFILYVIGFTAAVMQHNFLHSHNGLLKLAFGGLIVVGVLQAAVNVWYGRERSRTSRPENR